MLHAVGVCAARLLEEHGVDTIILEASDRIGGRLQTLTVIIINRS